MDWLSPGYKLIRHKQHPPWMNCNSANSVAKQSAPHADSSGEAICLLTMPLWFGRRGAVMRRVRVLRLGQERVELTTRHLQQIGVGIDPPCEGVVFLRSPSTFKLGSVLALAIQFEVIRIGKCGKLGRTDCLFGQDRRNEKDAFRLGQNQD